MNERARPVCGHPSEAMDSAQDRRRLRWFGHLQRRESGYAGQWRLKMDLPKKNQRWRLQRRFMGVVNKDMQTADLVTDPVWWEQKKCYYHLDIS